MGKSRRTPSLKRYRKRHVLFLFKWSKKITGTTRQIKARDLLGGEAFRTTLNKHNENQNEELRYMNATQRDTARLGRSSTTKLLHAAKTSDTYAEERYHTGGQNSRMPPLKEALYLQDSTT